MTVAGFLIFLVLIGGQVSALALSLIVATLLSALAAWELRIRGGQPAADGGLRPQAATRS